MKVFVLGLRGFPDIPGGVETHAENLYPRLAAQGYEITILGRIGYLDSEASARAYPTLRFVALWTLRRRSMEAFVHSFVGVIYAAFMRADLLHVHAIGPSLVAPLARVLGLKVVVTHHGPDYERQKWGRTAKLALKLGEFAAARFANRIIAISNTIEQLLLQKHGRTSTVIPNGVVIPEALPGDDVLEASGLQRGKYILNVGRFVPEKRHDDLIRAFTEAKIEGWKLVLVGDADHSDGYSDAIRALVRGRPDIVCTGYITGEPLRQFFAHAGVFVLPSSHEGLPIALLEALSWGVQTVASNIPANVEIGLEPHSYFPLGDVPALACVLRKAAATTWSDQQRDSIRRWVGSRYDWEDAAAKTSEVYRSVKENTRG
jgi:glycosyltransferase involved in cell wall biosynthesis